MRHPGAGDRNSSAGGQPVPAVTYIGAGDRRLLQPGAKRKAVPTRPDTGTRQFSEADSVT